MSPGTVLFDTNNKSLSRYDKNILTFQKRCVIFAIDTITQCFFMLKRETDMETGKKVNKEDFLNKFLDNFMNNYNEFLEFGINQIFYGI